MPSHVIGQYFLNDALDHDTLRQHIALFAEAGYQGVFPHARQGLDTPYDSRAWWEAIGVIIEACRKHGLQTWIWDEDCFPSGTGGGRVNRENPGLRSRSLSFDIHELTAEKDRPLKVDFQPGHLLAAFVLHEGKLRQVTPYCGTQRIHWHARAVRHDAYSPLISKAGQAHWRAVCDDNRYCLHWPSDVQGPVTVIAVMAVDGFPNHVDMLRPDGPRRFIELIYDPYIEHFKQDLGGQLPGLFTDEPSPGSVYFPWSQALPREFHKDHGYDLMDHLAHLAMDIDETSPAVRHHFRQTQGRLQRANYLGQLAHWCKKHNVQFAGHLTRTEWFSLVAAWWPNELQCYRQMDIPCCDPLGAAIAFPDAAAYHSGIKVVSSAAHLFNKQQAGADALAVVGDEATIQDFKFILDYHLALGVTYFALHGLSYSFRGPRKDEVPPSLSFQHTQFPHMRPWLDHTVAAADKLIQGKHVCRLALLYPSTSLGAQVLDDGQWPNLPEETRFHEVVETLLSHQRDFDFIDEITLAEKTDSRGQLNTPQAYDVIIVAHQKYIGQAAADSLAALAQTGTRIIMLGQTPIALGDKPDSLDSKWAVKPIETIDSLSSKIIASLPGVNVTGDGARDIFIHQRQQEGGITTFLFNRSPQDFQGQIEGQDVYVPARGSTFHEPGKPSHHPLTGTQCIEDLSADWQIDFQPNQAMLRLFGVTSLGDPGSDLVDMAKQHKVMDLLTRPQDPAGPGRNVVRYETRFMVSGEIDDMTLVLDPSFATGQWVLYVNNQPVNTFEQKTVFDTVNLIAQVGHLLRWTPSGALNTLTIETQGPGRGLHEPIHLTGSFTASLPHGQHSMPHLQAAPLQTRINTLQPWAAMGRPMFSGCATYRRSFILQSPQHVLLDLGSVHHSAKVSLDGRELATLAWSPFVLDLGQLAAGNHELAIEVCSSPANRDRLSNQTTGLLGPVRLMAR